MIVQPLNCRYYARESKQLTDCSFQIESQSYYTSCEKIPFDQIFSLNKAKYRCYRLNIVVRFLRVPDVTSTIQREVNDRIRYLVETADQRPDIFVQFA